MQAVPGYAPLPASNILHRDSKVAPLGPCTATLRQCPSIKILHRESKVASLEPYTAIPALGGHFVTFVTIFKSRPSINLYRDRACCQNNLSSIISKPGFVQTPTL
jgi:hypothetical protein